MILESSNNPDKKENIWSLYSCVQTWKYTQSSFGSIEMYTYHVPASQSSIMRNKTCISKKNVIIQIYEENMNEQVG